MSKRVKPRDEVGEAVRRRCKSLFLTFFDRIQLALFYQVGIDGQTLVSTLFYLKGHFCRVLTRLYIIIGGKPKEV